MQYKKEEVKNAILLCAEKEFMEKGFEKASIRSIAKSAGTTIGNFYNYFKSKESLFEELVNEEYESFIYFINHHNEIERPDYLWQSLDINQCRKILKPFIGGFMHIFSDRFLLLIKSSKGTKYENAKQLLQSYIEEHFIEHLTKHNPENIISSGFPSLIARQFLDGIVIILKENKEEEKRKNLIVELILFYFLGTMGLIGNE